MDRILTVDESEDEFLIPASMYSLVKDIDLNGCVVGHALGRILHEMSHNTPYATDSHITFPPCARTPLYADNWWRGKDMNEEQLKVVYYFTLLELLHFLSYHAKERERIRLATA